MRSDFLFYDEKSGSHRQRNLAGDKDNNAVYIRFCNGLSSVTSFQSRDKIALSFEYTRKEAGKTITYFDTYSATEHRKWRNDGGKWEEIEKEAIEGIGKIPGIYGSRGTPVWEDSNNVTEIEWAYSRNGNYLRRNSVPIYEVCDDEEIDFGKEKDDDERLILRLSRG